MGNGGMTDPEPTGDPVVYDVLLALFFLVAIVALGIWVGLCIQQIKHNRHEEVE
jgi:hypothetical protein